MTLKPKKVIALALLLTANAAYSEAPANAECVAEHFREHIDIKIELYNSVSKEMKNSHPEAFSVLKPCIDVLVGDAELSLATFESFWEFDRDILFKYSKKLRRLGAHYDRESLLKDEFEACERHPIKQRHEAWLIMREVAVGSFSNLVDRDIYFDSLKWPDISCKENQ